MPVSWPSKTRSEPLSSIKPRSFESSNPYTLTFVVRLKPDLSQALDIFLHLSMTIQGGHGYIFYRTRVKLLTSLRSFGRWPSLKQANSSRPCGQTVVVSICLIILLNFEVKWALIDSLQRLIHLTRMARLRRRIEAWLKLQGPLAMECPHTSGKSV